jgi:flagellar basal-body rod modification protein FlgD
MSNTTSTSNQINNFYNTSGEKALVTKGNSTLGKDDFLKLLVTQLKYQDPLKPMEDREFIAQSAQFSSLEQMTNLNQNMGMFLRMQAISNTAALIGKDVSYLVPSSKEGEQAMIDVGKVTEVKFVDGNTYITIDGKDDVPIEYLVTVKEHVPTAETTSDENKDK